MNKQIAQSIAQAAQNIINDEPLSDRYNVFVFDDGRVELEPVTGSLGPGYPANPDRYVEFHLDVPIGHLETTEDVLEHLN